MIADQSKFKLDSRFLGEPDGCRHPRIRYWHDNISSHGLFLGEILPQQVTALIDRAPKYHAIWPGKIDVLEDTIGVLEGRENLARLQPLIGED